MNHQTRNVLTIGAALAGGVIFWTALMSTAFAPAPPHPDLRDDALKEALRKDWQGKHQAVTALTARKLIFQKIDGDGKHVNGHYTGARLEYRRQPLPHVGQIEHSWPKGRLSEAGDTDLHHLFPVIPEANLARLNLHFGKVLLPVWQQGGSKSGPSRRGMPVFEVRKTQRGDTARAMFYVATMYDLKLDDAEEAALRVWHKQDPVSRAERARNERVESHQSSRNPFIDHPVMVERIQNF